MYSPGTNTCLSCGISWHWFKFCQFEAIVYAPLGVIIGFIRQQYVIALIYKLKSHKCSTFLFAIIEGFKFII